MNLRGLTVPNYLLRPKKKDTRVCEGLKQPLEKSLEIAVAGAQQILDSLLPTACLGELARMGDKLVEDLRGSGSRALSAIEKRSVLDLVLAVVEDAKGFLNGWGRVGEACLQRAPRQERMDSCRTKLSKTGAGRLALAGVEDTMRLSLHAGTIKT